MGTTLERACLQCAGYFNLVLDAVVHEAHCPNNPENAAPAPKPEPAPVASLTLARWNKSERPQDHGPLSALDVARAWIAEQAEQPEHIIVVIGRTTSDNSSATKYFQAGSYTHHSQMGLMLEGMHMMRDSG